MSSSLSNGYLDDVIAYPEQIGFSRKHLHHISFDKLSNYFGLYYLNTIFVEYLSKNRDMINTL